MEIKKDSRHYKLWREFGSEYSKQKKVHTTCSYVRGVCFAAISMILFAIMSAVGVLGLTYLAVCGLGVVPYVLFTGVDLVKDTFLHNSFYAGCGFLSGVLIIAMLILWDKVSRKLKQRSDARLLEQLVSDKKNKVCTVVTFK